MNVKEENEFEQLVKPEAKRTTRGITLFTVIYLLVVGTVLAVVESLDVSENMLILLKIGWLAFSIFLPIVIIKIVVRRNIDGDGSETSD